MPFDPAKLKAAREKAKLTQTQAAQRAGKTQGDYSNIEAGRKPNITIRTAEACARAVGVELIDLITTPAGRRQKGRTS
jgi:transcriptional regulator with XRE-family HTH domain